MISMLDGVWLGSGEDRLLEYTCVIWTKRIIPVLQYKSQTGCPLSPNELFKIKTYMLTAR